MRQEIFLTMAGYRIAMGGSCNLDSKGVNMLKILQKDGKCLQVLNTIHFTIESHLSHSS